MRRGTFLKGTAGALAALWAGRIPVAEGAATLPDIEAGTYIFQETMIGSGGICVPVTTMYDLPVRIVGEHPIRDSLPAFQISRGGVEVYSDFQPKADDGRP